MNEIMSLLAALRASVAAHPGIKGLTFDSKFLPQTAEHLNLELHTDEALEALAASVGGCAPTRDTDGSKLLRERIVIELRQQRRFSEVIWGCLDRSRL